MAWLAVNKEYAECIFDNKPERHEYYHYWEDIAYTERDDDFYNTCIELPQGTIKKLIGRELTWEDEPVEI